jgi:hypothetical protein
MTENQEKITEAREKKKAIATKIVAVGFGVLVLAGVGLTVFRSAILGTAAKLLGPGAPINVTIVRIVPSPEHPETCKLLYDPKDAEESPGMLKVHTWPENHVTWESSAADPTDYRAHFPRLGSPFNDENFPVPGNTHASQPSNVQVLIRNGCFTGCDLYYSYTVDGCVLGGVGVHVTH